MPHSNIGDIVLLVKPTWKGISYLWNSFNLNKTVVAHDLILIFLFTSTCSPFYILFHTSEDSFWITRH